VEVETSHFNVQVMVLASGEGSYVYRMDIVIISSQDAEEDFFLRQFSGWSATLHIYLHMSKN